MTRRTRTKETKKQTGNSTEVAINSDSAIDSSKVLEASESLSRSLHLQGSSYTEPILQLYTTSIHFIIFIHLLFLYQFRRKKTRKDVNVTYDDVVMKKRYHRALLAVLSHPPHDRAHDYDDLDQHDDGDLAEDRNHDVSIPSGNAMDVISEGIFNHSTNSTRRGRHNYTFQFPTTTLQLQQKLKLFIQTILYKIKKSSRTFIHGPLSTLPLLAYTCHIIWQCRPLEELYDYASSDRHYPSMHHPEYNITAIIAADTVLHQSFQERDSNSDRQSDRGSHAHGHHRNTEESVRYHRVLVVLMFTSLCIDLLVTHFGLMYIRDLLEKRRRGLRTSGGAGVGASEDFWGYDEQSQSPSPSQENNGGGAREERQVQHTFERTIMDRGLCTLTPLCISLLIIYAEYFPYTPISILPVIPTSSILAAMGVGVHSSTVSFIFCYAILGILSYRIYPLAGMLFGSISGLLWINGITTFMATAWWGNGLITFLVLLCAVSYKVEYMSLNGRSSRRTMGMAPLQGIDWVPCIESVIWDENGCIVQEYE